MTFSDCYNCTNADWGPLERAVSLAANGNVEADPQEILSSFMWMGEWKQGEHSYKHRDTRNYARLRADSTPEECCREIVNALYPGRTWGKEMDAKA